MAEIRSRRVVALVGVLASVIALSERAAVSGQLVDDSVPRDDAT